VKVSGEDKFVKLFLNGKSGRAGFLSFSFSFLIMGTELQSNDITAVGVRNLGRLL
jgi:hypothetical protein